MAAYGVNELRKMFLDFFESKNHYIMKSFSLVPHNDNSLLLINAGMAPLKPYFTGQEVPPCNRVATCQKCVRTGDIEQVGKTARHLTFFEMLGNFSFGDYFKKEAIAWSWEFLTKDMGFDPDRLYPSIYFEDDEAGRIWNEDIGIPYDRITKFYRDENGKSDNFWEHGAGPCGPCSEIYYDRGIEYGCGSKDCKVGCECDRFVEIWNNVFTQYNGDGQGNYEELKNKNIDTGMGLERLAMVSQGVGSVFDIDTMKSIRDRLCEIAGIKYNESSKYDVSIRLITDHIRSSTFMISDGIIPSNEGRGYVLRRLIRRAARHGKLLGINDRFLSDLSETVISESRDGYPELEDKRAFILNLLMQEEDKFHKTIDQGLKLLNELKDSIIASGSNKMTGYDAFRLYDTYGFPIDLTMEILGEEGIEIVFDGFEKAMEEQRTKARGARKTTDYMGADATVYEELGASDKSEFLGYNSTLIEGKVLALTTDKEVVTSLEEGEEGSIIADKTPFYATKGGQNADIGVIRQGEAIFEVYDTIWVVGERIAHVGRVISGCFAVGDVIKLEVDKNKRADTCSNHSATHLLHKALKTVLGDHVEQAGSLVSDDRLRFDFSHYQAMTEEEIKKVEEIVNDNIMQRLEVRTDIMSIDEAKMSGAVALFGEKYGESVRVLTMGDYSRELCGGTHVKNTGDIIRFKILSESGIAAGVRRIEAITGREVFNYYTKIEEEILGVSKLAKTMFPNIKDKFKSLMEEIKCLKSENESLKSKLNSDKLSNVGDSAIDMAGIKVLVTRIDNVDMSSLRDMSDTLKSKLGEGVVVLASSIEGKVNLVVSVTKEAVSKGVHAGNIVKLIAPLVGGGGGGRPDMAQAGGKDPSRIDDAVNRAKKAIEEILK